MTPRTTGPGAYAAMVSAMALPVVCIFAQVAAELPTAMAPALAMTGFGIATSAMPVRDASASSNHHTFPNVVVVGGPNIAAKPVKKLIGQCTRPAAAR